MSDTLGNNGWYVSDVTVSWTVADPESTVSSTTGCGTTVINYDTAGVTLTCTATSAGGTSEQSVTIKRDATPPVVTATLDRSPDSNGWYNHTVSVSFSGSDATSGIASCTAPVSYSGPDSSSASVSGTCTDNAGNVGSASFDFQYDATPPDAEIALPDTGLGVGVYLLNEVVSATWSASDNLSGVAPPDMGAISIDTGSVGGPQTFTVPAGTAVDLAGNPSAEATATYYVRYAFGGILQPINRDGSSIFKLGSTVPVKFQLRDATGAFITNAVARIYVPKVSNGIAGTELEAVSTSAATTGNLFRYDYTGNQYIFNLATKSLSSGTWQIRIELDDGTSQYAYISLR